jgi:hypothetical protein
MFKMKIKKFFIAFILISHSVWAGENQIVLLGAGGEEEGKASTIFDNSARLLSRYYNKNSSSYQAMVSYNGGHANTEKIVKNDFNKASVRTSFTPEGYQKVMNELLAKIKSNPPKIGAGNQIMIFIDSHGAEKLDGEASHSISMAYSPMEDMNSGSSKKGGMLNLDVLKEITDLAKEKNINLAIIDGSCHSGNTLSLANDITCVISGSAANQFATDFTDFLVKEFTPGRSLEDAFIKARAKADGVPFPMISSPAGSDVQEKMQNFMPYLFYHENEEELDKIDKHLKENGNAIGICKKEMEFGELRGFLDFMRDFKRFQSNKNPNELDRLKANIEKYKKVQMSYLRELDKYSVPDAEMDRKTNFTSGDFSKDYTNGELIETDFKSLIDNAKEDEQKAKTEEDKNTYKHFANIYTDANKKKNELLKNETFKKRFQIYERIKLDKNLSESVARTISVDLKKVYEAYYKDQMMRQRDKPNPCANFKL